VRALKVMATVWASPWLTLIATGFQIFTSRESITGLALADFMVGRTSNYQQGNNGEDYNRSNYYSLYAQDSWRVSSQLNINYGIRWEPYLPERFKGTLPEVEHFNMGLFLKGVKSTVFPNAPAGLMFNGDPSMPGAASNADPLGFGGDNQQ